MGESDSGGDADRVDTAEEDPGTFSQYVAPLITEHPWRIVAAFLVVTVLFASGIGGGGEQQAGTDQFTEDLEEAEALEDMEADFDRGTRSSGGAGATMFISDDRNVLSKPSLLRMLEAQDRLETRDGLRVTSTTSPASNIALQLDPTAGTPEAQYRVIERASDGQIDAAIRDAAEAGALGPVSTDFTAASASADVAQIAVSYDTPPMAGTDTNSELQSETVEIVGNVDGYETGENVVVFGDAIIQDEILQLLNDTAIVVFPAAILLILFFLLISYRDPIDLALGLVALLMTMIWTFGFMGYAGIPFGDTIITVFPLLLAVGIDFGIHIINRYREERETGVGINDAMGITTGQLMTAFLMVTITTVVAFGTNITSSMMRDFGIVSSFGIAFTLLIFGIFLPAGKVGLDSLREGTRIPSFGTTPIGTEGAGLSSVLQVGTRLARIAPRAVLVSALVIGLVGGAYGTGVDTEFSQEAFFPDEDRIEQYEALPEPFAPGEYTFIDALDHLEEDFDQGFVGTVTVYVDDRDVRSDMALTDVDRALDDPPPAFEASDRRAEASSIVGVMEAQAAADPEFAALVERSDSNGDGIPDRNVDQVYKELLDSPRGDEARTYLAGDRSATRIEYQVAVGAETAEATAGAETVADNMRMDATPTGDLVVNQAVMDEISESAIQSLVLSVILTAIFLVLVYRWLEGQAIYGLLNLVPVLVTVGVLAGSMRYFGIPLSPFNASILAVSIGLGVDYTVHFMHRFVDEYEAGNGVDKALRVTVRGTGGALTGSMLTTVCGLGVLYLALIPLIAEFGVLLALSIFYAYLSSILVLPSTIVVWHDLSAWAQSTEHSLPSGVSWLSEWSHR